HCAICFEDIPVGSRVRAQREVYNGKVMTFRMCPKCCNAVVQDWREGDCLHMEERINIGMGRSGAYPETPRAQCRCGHSQMMHPFGLSENLGYTGTCMVCDCKEFDE